MNRAIVLQLCVVASALLLIGCAAPFSELQSARLVGKGRVEVTGSYSAVSSTYRGTTGDPVDHVGAQLATGVSDHADLRLRYERIVFPDSDGEGINVVGAGPKISLIKDHLALYAPVGFAFGEEIESSETWEVHPAVLLTAVPSRYLDVTGSWKLLVALTAEGAETRFAFNLGLGISSNLDRWAIRPEVGVMAGSGGGYMRHLSVGLAVATGPVP